MSPTTTWEPTYFDDRQRDHVQRRLVHRLERLGYVVTLEALTTTS